MLVLVLLVDQPFAVWKFLQLGLLLATFLALAYTAGFVAERKGRCAGCWATAVFLFAPLILPLLAIGPRRRDGQ